MDLRDSNILQLLPRLLQEDSTSQAICVALDRQFREIGAALDKILLYASLDTLPEPVLDALAYHLHVDEYDGSYPLDTKRSLVESAIRVHRYRGTKYACEQVLQGIFGPGSRIEEWFEYEGEPFHFRVRTTNVSATGEMEQQLRRALEVTQNVRSHLEAIIVEMTTEGSVYLGGCLRVGEVIHI